MKHQTKRRLAAALAFTMAVTMFPSSLAKAAEAGLAAGNGAGQGTARVTAEPLAAFDFEEEAQGGKFTSMEAVASVNGTVQLQERDAENGKALYLDGAAGWLSLTKSDNSSLLTGLTEITVSFDAKPDRTDTNWGFYAAPNTNTQTYNKEHYIGALINGGKTTVERYNNTNGRPASASAATGTDWSHVDVVFRESATELYVNGIRRSVVESAHKLPEILGQNSIFQVGKANWGNSGEYYKGWIDNFKVYGQALDVDQLSTPEALQAAVQADKESLDIGLLDLKASHDFTLPSKGENGCDITWASGNPAIVVEGSKAKVTRPSADEADQAVTLTATITMGSVSDTKAFSVIVLKEMDDAAVVDKALEMISIPNQDDIRDNISLPSEIEVEGTEKKASVEWVSSNKNVVTDTASADGRKAAGIVTRPEPGQPDLTVTLQATVTQGSISKKSQAIPVTVKAKKKQEKTVSYLFAHFTGTEGRQTDEQIYFATSEDGSRWMDMTANGSPALSSSIGEKGVRDPYLLRSPNGDKFYLIATDLSIYYRGGWGNAHATVDGSTKLVIWESTDLIHWGEPRLADVASRIPGAGMAWAPEACYDPETGNYVVYWATASSESNHNGDVTNMYYATTRDFYTFSEPVLWIDRDHSIIDTTMIYDDTAKKYCRASGDGQITIEQSDSIYEGWEIIGTLSKIFNNNNYSGAKLEGPEFFEYCEDDWQKDGNGNPIRTWGLMCDQYSEGKGYLPFRSTNLADMTTASWSPASDVDFGSLKKRHGTILPITDAEYKAVMEYFGHGAGDGGETEKKLLADFDFNTEPQDGKFTSEEAVATVIGTGATLQERDAAQGKALYFDGSASYLDVKKSNNSSLLTGLKEFTISFEAKPDRTSTNWGFYAAPNADRQGVNGEHYIGALINGGTTTLERYHQSGSRPRSASAPTGTDWTHVDAVFSETDTAIYLDGVKVSTEASNYALTDILGGTSIFQIGKANWGNGEYTKGWIDNFKVYNKALSEAEIQSVPNEAYRQSVLERQAAKIAPVTIREERITLPSYGKTVTWKSNMDDITILEDGLTAVTKQPAAGGEALTGKLTAVVSVYGMTAEVDVDVTVRPQVGENDPYGYMMVHFIEDSNGYAEKIYLDISRGDNPEQWDPLNGGAPILVSNLGKTGSRDPFLTYSPETGTYYILATDLRVFGGDNAGWGAWTKNYSTKMNIWESKDLITWSEVRQFDVSLGKDGQKMANLGMMWAPEATWVPDYYGEGKGAFVVYWSSQCYKDEAQEQADSGSKIMWGATTDFTQETWEYGGVFLDGGPKGWIDTTIIQNGNKTYHITKSNAEEIIMESTTDREWWKPGTNWTRIQSNIGQSRFGAVEGPAVFKDHSNDSRWYLFVDDLPTPGYQPMVSTDLDKGWDYLDSPDYFLTSFTKHGGVISLTKKQYDAVRRADAVSLADDKRETVTVPNGAAEESIRKALPATAKVNLAYHMGTSDLPIDWDLSAVKANTEGIYTVTGTVRSIGANKNQWKGRGDSDSYLAEDKTLYSSKALQVTADVKVDAAAEIAVAAVSLDQSAITLAPGKSQALKASITPANATNQALKWESSNADVAAVAQDGTVTAIKAGTADVTVSTANGKTAVCKVTVKEAELPVEAASVSLDRTSISLTIGKSQTLKATVFPENAANKTLSWKSGNPKVAAVEQSGRVTALKAGTANITVSTANGKTASCKVTVRKARVAVKAVKLSQKKATLGVKEKIALKATVTPSNATDKKVSWKSDKPSVASVNAKGQVTAKKPGTAKITATADGKRATCQITVKKAPSKITLSASKKAIKRNKTLQLKVKLPKNTASNKITYSSSNKKVATVSASGKVKGLKKGTATITAKTYNGKKAKVRIRVK